MIFVSDLTDDELTVLRSDLEAVFRANSDPTDLPKDLRLAAEKELNEEPDKMKANIKALKQLIEDEEGLKARAEDLFLAAFLRGKKHDVTKAFQCLKNFYDFKSRYSEMYKFILPTTHPKVFAQNHMGNIAPLDRKGRKIFFIVPARFNIDEIPMIETFKMGTSIFELMLHDLTLQVSGTIIIFDMANLSLIMQARMATPTLAWHLCMLVQDKIPMRVKAIHIVNQPFYFSACFAVFKPFLKKKIRKRVFMHGTDLESLHKHIDPENLPVEYGGSRPPFSSQLTTTIIQLNESKYEEWSKYGYNKL
ncbi:CRAL_TRIO_N [Nesidiocoris tenuis]|uniref:CRAL_TRIO_N n=1 Tax=Nesidiocoris tenuis TaxID=355587 RepID=A0ABN7AE03_9HEMI|nr:CRAL_TRIO_N [Nesidiocoris tenuis]